MKKIYVAGKINGEPNFKTKFQKTCTELKKAGYIALNPAALPAGMAYEDYMAICFVMIEVADAVYFLHDYVDSPGALREELFAKVHMKPMYYQAEGDLTL